MSLASIGAAQITCLHWIKESQRKSHSQFPLRISKLHCLNSFSCFHRFYLNVNIWTLLLELNISTNLVMYISFSIVFAHRLSHHHHNSNDNHNHVDCGWFLLCAAMFVVAYWYGQMLPLIFFLPFCIWPFSHFLF